MLSIPRFFVVNASHPIRTPHLFSVSVSAAPPCPSFRKPNPLIIAMASSQSVVAEYAKSNRSSCKACSKAIESKSLRLGLVSRVKRGFGVTKWHHLRCFPLPSHSSPDTITGFSSLKSTDQEALKKLYAGQDKCEEDHKSTEDVQNEQQETKESDSNKRKVCKATEDIQNEQKETEGDSKKRKLCTSDVKAVMDICFSVSDVKSKYKDATLLPKWKAFQTVIFLEQDDGLHDSSKIAAFDFDGCLAKTAVNRVGPNAWSLMFPSIPDKLQSLYNNGYKLVIFTNESNIERWKNKRQVAVDSKIGRLNNFIEKVKVPVQVFIACGLGKEDDPFRKPKPGMWQLMEQHFNSSITIEMDQLCFLLFGRFSAMVFIPFLNFSLKIDIFTHEGMRMLSIHFLCCRSFYVGDAAGRESDHSDADIKFAETIGLKFYVPEEYFDTSS